MVMVMMMAVDDGEGEGDPERSNDELLSHTVFTSRWLSFYLCPLVLVLLFPIPSFLLFSSLPLPLVYLVFLYLTISHSNIESVGEEEEGKERKEDVTGKVSEK
jgi:hypothetical protein